MAKYLGLYVSEAGDHLAKLASLLVKLEQAVRQGEPPLPLVDEMFRHAHSVKGMSASMELDGIAAVAHQAEDLLDFFRRRAAVPDAPSVDLLLAAVDALQGMVQAASKGGSPPPDAALAARLSEAVESLEKGPPPAEGATAPSSAPEQDPQPLPPAAPEAPLAPANGPRRRVQVEVEIAASSPVPSVRGFLVLKKLSALGAIVESSPSVQDLRAGRIPGRKLTALVETSEPASAIGRALAQISDVGAFHLRDREAVPPAPAAREAAPAAADPPRSVRVRTELLDSFLDGVGELILATARLREIGKGVPEPWNGALDEGVSRLHATVKDLHDKVMAVRMTPLALVTDRLPRAARDLARGLGKQVEVEVRGAEIEIDRAILDELGDPLLHLLRNAVDHGVEAPHLRLLSGKPATGRISVSARRERDRVLLEIADDGKGMDAERLRTAAVARGAITAEAARQLTDREALMLCCLPGLSTAESVTDVSGRGVGMDAVKRAIEAVGGTVEIESQRGAGARFVLRLPLTVAVQPVLLVRVGEEVLGLPVAKVHGAARVVVERLERSQGSPMLAYDGKLVPVRDLGELLGFASGRRAERSVVVADGDGARVGLAVDDLLGQQEAVLKPLARPFDLVPGLSAVTVLGSGRPVFILDVQKLVAA